MESKRDYGLGNFPPESLGTPRVAREVPQPCPSCKCDHIYEIEIPVKHRLLTAGYGLGTYLGCACCTWASPMTVVSGVVTGTKTKQ